MIKLRIWRGKISLNYAYGPCVITRILARERGRKVRVRDRFKDIILLTLKTEEEAVSQGMQVASKS